MKQQTLVRCSLIAAALLLQSSLARAQDAASGKFIIAYRLPKPKTVHFEDAAKAKAHAETAKSLGCEVKQDSHSGHIDVSYTLAGWKAVSVETDELADNWEGWMTKAGFEAIHGHDHAPHGGEAVEYRSEKWLTKHFDTAAAATDFISVCRGLGCEWKQDQNVIGEFDIQFRQSTWRHLETPNHDVAHERQEWLKKLGFETKHAH